MLNNRHKHSVNVNNGCNIEVRDHLISGGHLGLFLKVLVLALTIYNEGAYLTFKSIFHKALTVF